MEMNELIARINFLYHKKQSEGLTAAEQREQAELRRQYIDIMKGNVQSQLERIQLVDEPASQEPAQVNPAGRVSKEGCCGKSDCHCNKN